LCQRAYLLACAGDADAAAAVLKDLTIEHSWRQREAFVEAQAMQRVPESSPLLDAAIQHAALTGNIRSELRFRRLRVMTQARADDASRIGELEASSGFKRAFVLTTRQRGAMAAASQPGAALFTPREMAVLEKLDAGLTDKSIAIALGITAHGVRHHLKRIYSKLNARDRAQAREKVRQAGIRFPGPPARGVH
jgi:DNA-binding NarL/FixJ family response regulator